MTKVSTRPQGGATTTAKPVKTKALASASPASETTDAFHAVASALYAAAQTDEPHERSGDSDRLLRIAGDLADVMAIRPESQSAENVGYDIAALVKASRLVPGDTCSAERVALIEEARPHLVFLTDCHNVLSPDSAPLAAVGDLLEETPVTGSRREVGFQAIIQIDALLGVLRRERGEEGFEIIIEAMIPRLIDLTSVAMSILSFDPGRTTAEMELTVHGEIA